MKFIDLFAGIGGFRKGFEMAGHECVGFCEYDKYATASYTAMHCVTDEQYKNLIQLPKIRRQKEILKDEYRNGEWYISDIRAVNSGNVPACDCWCFGAPCTDFSLVGNRAGLGGEQSSLVREVFRGLREVSESDRPQWVVYENVKGMLTSNGGRDYLEILLSLDELGYDCEWQILNSAYYGVPQNRERVYTVGHHRAYGEKHIFPVKQSDIEDAYRTSGGKVMQIGKRNRSGFINPQEYRLYSTDGLCPTLITAQGGGKLPHILDHGKIRRLTPRECFRLQGWSDDYYERAEAVNSDTQLYKQAGNGVTVPVAYTVGKKIATAMEEVTDEP